MCLLSMLKLDSYDSNVDYSPVPRDGTQTITRKRTKTGKWQCKKCDVAFDAVKHLKKHRKEHKRKLDESKYKYMYNEAERTYTCKTCDTEAKALEEIEKHVQSHEDSYACQDCKSSFQNAYSYSVHLCPNGRGGCDSYRCPLCDFKTIRKTTIRKHINVHFNKFVYNCSFCGKGFDDVLNFREHEATHTNGGKQFSCVVCRKEFSFSRYLLTHQIRTHKATIDGIILPNQCPICKKIFAKRISVDNHMIRHDYALPHEKKHLCDICGKGFFRKNKLEIHYRVHTGIKPYACSYCSKSFTKRDYLIMHERIHSGEKPYSCEHCGKCFNQGAPLRIHVRGHTGERPYVCHLCNIGFISKGALNLHFKTCTGSILISVERNTIYSCEYLKKKSSYTLPPTSSTQSVFEDKAILNYLNSEPDRVVPCPMCDLFFETKKQLRNHRRRNHETKHMCTQCDQLYHSYSKLKKHKFLAHDENDEIKALSCDMCNKTFATVKNHRRHVQMFHESGTFAHRKSQFRKDQTYQCAICGNIVGSPLTLKHHMIRHASSCVCELCGKVVTTVNSLNNHMRTHSGEKPYGCGVCKKSFRTRSAVRTHLLVHTKEKPHTCDVCGKSYSQKSTLNVHRKAAHTGERGHECSVCDKTFVTKTLLKMHVKKVHKPAEGQTERK